MAGEQRRVAFALLSPGVLWGGGHGLGSGMGRSQERKCGEVSGGSKAISRAPEDCVFDVLIGAWPATCSVPVGPMTPRAGRASQGFSYQQAGPGWGGQLCHPPTSHFRASVCPSVSSNTQPEGLLGEIMKITPGITPTSEGRLSPLGCFNVRFALSFLLTALTRVFPGWESPSPKRPHSPGPHTSVARGQMHDSGVAKRMLSSVIVNPEHMTRGQLKVNSLQQPWTRRPFVSVVWSCPVIQGHSWFPLPV